MLKSWKDITDGFLEFEGDSPQAAGILARNADGSMEVLCVNEAFRKMFPADGELSGEEIGNILMRKDLLLSAFSSGTPVTWNWFSHETGSYLLCRCRKAGENMIRFFVAQDYNAIRSLLDIFPVGIIRCSVTEDLKVTETYINRTARIIAGSALEPLQGKSVSDLCKARAFADEDIRKAEEVYEKFFSGDGPEDFELRIRHSDGTIRWIEGSLRWIMRGRNYMAVYQDITQRKNAECREEHANALLEKILSTTQTAIFWKDADRRFLGANRAFLDYYGFPSEDVLIGKNDEDMGWHTDPENYRNDELQVIQEGISTTRVPGTCISRGENRNIVASKSPMFENGKIVGLVGSFEDVTREVRQNREIEELNRRLEESLSAEKKANNAKTDFLARMSHDMRTPLTTVIGLCDIAFEHYSDTELLRYFRNIKDSSEYLFSILTDILDMEKLIKGNIPMKKTICSHSETAETVQAIIRPLAEAKKIRLLTEFHCDHMKCYARADTRKVQRVILNILNNAVKYTGEGGCIRWRTDIREENEKTVTVVHTISDDGAGISEEFQKVMFEPFTQAAASVDQGGTGLGLAIAKKMVDLMGGSIKCISAPGRGTTFVVSIPHEKATEEEAAEYRRRAEKKPDTTGMEGCHILVSEDNDVNAEIIMKILETRGITTERAKDGREAVGMAERGTFDAILMDIRMPVMNGYEATAEIRKFNGTVPIIALSANDFSEDIERSLSSGMNAHLEKPIDTGKLFQTIESLVYPGRQNGNML